MLYEFYSHPYDICVTTKETHKGMLCTGYQAVNLLVEIQCRTKSICGYDEPYVFSLIAVLRDKC